jgi:hypothetical protein
MGRLWQCALAHIGTIEANIRCDMEEHHWLAMPEKVLIIF